MKLFLAFFLLLCACQKTPEKPDPEVPQSEIEARYEEVYQRLNSRFLENGWVVSRNPDGTPEHQGDSLIWSGVLLSVAKCEDTLVEDTLIDMIERHEGALVRFEPLGEYENGRQVTLDGALGLYRGIGSRVARCPNAAARWFNPVVLHRQYLADHDNSLNINSSGKLGFGFEKLPAILMGSQDESINGLLTSIVAWTSAVKATKSAAFRVNLGFLAIQTLEQAGYVIPGIYRNGFCQASDGIQIPTVDHWCSRGDLARWIEEFSYNVWEYRHQRSGAWETPDGAPNESPALDYLVAVRQYFK